MLRLTVESLTSVVGVFLPRLYTLRTCSRSVVNTTPIQLSLGSGYVEAGLDTALFLTLFLFAVQTAAGVAPMRWPHHTWLAGLIFYVSGIFAVACLVWWSFSNWDWLMSALQPPQVIALGLAVALGGLIWQWKRTPPPSPEIADLRSQVSGLEVKLALASAQKPAASAMTVHAPAPTVHYNERDIRELLDAMKDAKFLVESSILPTSIEIEGIVANSFHRLREDGATKFTPTRLREMRDKLKTTIWDPFDKFVYKDHEEYKAQMRVIFLLNNEAVKGELNRSLLAFAEDVERLPNQPSQETLELIRPRYEETRRQSNILYNWVVQVRNRIASVTTNLQTQGVLGVEEK